MWCFVGLCKTGKQGGRGWFVKDSFKSTSYFFLNANKAPLESPKTLAVQLAPAYCYWGDSGIIHSQILKATRNPLSLDVFVFPPRVQSEIKADHESEFHKFDSPEVVTDVSNLYL